MGTTGSSSRQRGQELLLEIAGVGMFTASTSSGLDQSRVSRPSRGKAVRRTTPETASCSHREDQEVPADLLSLEDFNDQELLRGLWARYEKKSIYTWVGGVLVSVNPYADVGAFREDIANSYASSNPPQAPHLYATVQQALVSPGARHALLITGESGAGKTEATRAVLSFLAMRHTSTDYIRDRLLRSTPVLEAFGNAHTRQNTNSSRFGKFIEVHLSAENEVVGATLTPYMLEASRVSGDLPTGERTYHIFYLLRAALGALAAGEAPNGSLWSRMSVEKEWAELIKTGGSLMGASKRLSNGPKDARCLEGFENIVDGLTATGMRNIEVAECCRIVAAVALLSDTELGEEGLAGAAKLLRIEEQQVQAFLSRVEMSVGAKERVFRERSKAEAVTLRASLAQELYAALFAWLTRLVARGIAPRKAEGGRMLGLLDLYGFEVFPTNGFEQFLINYCNERLQQFFNRQVFTCEAEEYAAEGLDSDGQWSRLTTACQLPALALLEGHGGVGIFNVLNDRSKCNFEETVSGGGSGALAETLASSCGGHAAFCRASGRDTSRLFGVKHFAGEVFYEAAHFVRKNASAHRPDIVAFLRDHGGSFVREVLAGEAEEAEEKQQQTSSSRRGRKLFGRTLITIFQQELNELCHTLEARQCKHIRCLRPNDEQKPLVFDDASMLRQCRYSGLLEATRIRKQGYAHRRPLAIFASRFALLLNTPEARQAARQAKPDQSKAACQDIRQVVIDAGIAAEDVSVGRTKVFLREHALTWLEAMRTHVALAVIVSLLRGHQTRQWFLRSRRAVVALQAWTRGVLGRKEAAWRRQLLAARRVARERAAAERAAAEEADRAIAEAAAAKAASRALACIRHDAASQLQRCWRARCARRAAREYREQLCLMRETDGLQQSHEVFHQQPTPKSRRPQERQVEPSLRVSNAHSEQQVVHAAPQWQQPASAVGIIRGSVTPHGRHTGGQVFIRPPNKISYTRPLEPHELIETSSKRASRDESLRALHRYCHQECIKLLSQHERLPRNLPNEQHGLLAELVKTTDFLSSNSWSVAKDHLVAIRDRINHIKVYLQGYNAALASLAGGPELAAPRHMPLSHLVPCSPLGASAHQHQPAGMARTPSRPEMPRSMSAFAVRAQSPRGSGYRSPMRTPTGSARSLGSTGGLQGYQTPMRASCSSAAPPPVVGHHSTGSFQPVRIAQQPVQHGSHSYVPAFVHAQAASPLHAELPRPNSAVVPSWAWQAAPVPGQAAAVAVPAGQALPMAHVQEALKHPQEVMGVRTCATPSRMRSPSQAMPQMHVLGTPSRKGAGGSPPPRATMPGLMVPTAIMASRAPSSSRASSPSVAKAVPVAQLASSSRSGTCTPSRGWSRLQSPSPCRNQR